MCSCVCAYTMRQWNSLPLNVIVACSICRMPIHTLLSLQSIAYHIPSAQTNHTKETTLLYVQYMRTVCSHSCIWRCSCALRQDKQGCHFECSHEKRKEKTHGLVSSFPFLSSKKCIQHTRSVPTLLHRIHLIFRNYRIPSTQDQHIFRTFWLTKKKRATIFYRTLFIVFS